MKESRVPFRDFADFNRPPSGLSFLSYLTQKLKVAGIPVNDATLTVELDFVADCIVWRQKEKPQ